MFTEAMNATELKQIVTMLKKELNILRQREAKYAGYAPLDLLNQIEDYRTAIALTEQVTSGELSEIELREALKPLNLSLNIARRFFYDEFVIYPSNHGSIIFHSDQRPTPQPRPRPVHQRSSLPITLLDRQQEVNTGIASLLSAPQAVEFYGRAGVGKTTLLRYLAHHVPDASFPDGIIYRSIRRKGFNDLCQEIFDAFYDRDLSFKPTEGEILRYLNTLQALIILDDVDLDRDEIEALVDAAPNCAFLFASIEQHLYGGGRAIPLKGLPADDALKLVEQELLAVGQPLTSEEHAAARAICVALDGHPLNILQIITQARNENRALAEVAAQLAETPSDRKRAALLLASLSKPEKFVVFALVTVGGAALLSEHIAAITDLADPLPVLNTLLQRHLIQTDGVRYLLTDKLTQMSWPGQDLAYWAKRALDHFVAWSEQYQRQPDLLLEETDAIQQILEWAVEAGHWPEALRLTRTVESSLAWLGRWDAWEQVLQAGLQAAQASGHRAAEAWIHNQLGVRALCLGDTSAADKLLDQALHIREEIGDVTGAAVTRHNLTYSPLVTPPPPQQVPQPPTSPSPLLIGTIALLLGLGGLALWLFWPRPPTTQVVIVVSPTPTPPISTPIPTSSFTPRPTVTPETHLQESLPTATPTATATPTDRPTSTATSTNTPTFTPTDTPTNTPTFTPTPTDTPTNTPTFTPTPTDTPTNTPTFTPTPTDTPTNTPMPVVIRFLPEFATINEGACIDLEWQIENVQAAFLSGGKFSDQGVGGPFGSLPVCPPVTTIYTLRVDTRTSTITVIPKPTTPQILYDFVANAWLANWTGYDPNGPTSYPLVFNKASGSTGAAQWRVNPILEDGSSPARVLDTHPTWTNQGEIHGKYQFPITFQKGDRFVGRVGFHYGAGAGNVTFKVIINYIKPGGGEFCCDATRSLSDNYDGLLKNWAFPVPEEVIGQQISSVELEVEAGASSAQDWAIWEVARLERP